MIRKLLVGAVVFGWSISEAVAFYKLNHVLSWWAGSTALWIVASMAILEICLSAAVLFEVVEATDARRLHVGAVAVFLTVAIAIFVALIEHGSLYVPESVAVNGLKMQQRHAVILGAFIISLAHIVSNVVFLSLLGCLLKRS